MRPVVPTLVIALITFAVAVECVLYYKRDIRQWEAEKVERAKEEARHPDRCYPPHPKPTFIDSSRRAIADFFRLKPKSRDLKPDPADEGVGHTVEEEDSLAYSKIDSSRSSSIELHRLDPMLP